jgi:hypothetical protein
MVAAQKHDLSVVLVDVALLRNEGMKSGFKLRMETEDELF